MSAPQLLRHSRKLQSLRNIVVCERPGVARYFSTGPGSFAVEENGVEKIIGGAGFSQYKQPGNNLETCKVSAGGVNGSSACKGTLTNRITSGVTGLNGSLSRFSGIMGPRTILRSIVTVKNPLQGLTNGGDPMSRVMQIRKLNDGINRPFPEDEIARADRMGGFTGADRMGGSSAFAVPGGDRMGGSSAFAVPGGDRMGGFTGGGRMGGFTGGDTMGGFTPSGRMGGNGGFTPGGRMGGGFTPGGRMGGNGGFTAGGRTSRFNMDLLQPTGQRVKRDVLHITQKGKKTFVTVTDVKGNRKAGASAGCLEDRKGRSRLARYAGEATGEHMGRSARKMGIKSVVVRVKGYSFFRKKKKIVMGFADGFRGERVRTPSPIMYIHDVTQLAHNGCRLPKKTRK